MELGDVLVIKGEFRIYNPSRTTYVPYGEKTLYIPCATGSNRPGPSTNLVVNGLETSYAEQFKEWFPDYEYLTAVGFNSSIAPNTLFYSYFPHMIFEDESDGRAVLILNSGKVLEFAGYVNFSVCESISAFESGTYLYTSPRNMFSINPNALSGAQRGRTSPVYYTTVVDGVPSDFYNIQFTGISSVNQNLQIETYNSVPFNRVLELIADDVETLGYSVTYSLSGCTSDENNPTTIPTQAETTTMLFTANDGYIFTEDSVRIAGSGYPSGDVQFNWNPDTGELTVGRISSAISITVRATRIDPYAEAGYTEPEDGNGSFDFDGDSVTMSTLPTVSFASTGFVRIYNPSLQKLGYLASYMWTDQTFIQTVINHAKQLLENPIESIISLNLLPCPIPSGADEEVKVLFIPTGVNMPPVTAQFVEVDCGSVQLTETYGSALDYSPYTKVHCFLPYIGTVTLDTDEVMGKTISIKYRVDIATGVCVAHIMLDGDVYYQFSGHCAVAMPLTSADFSTYIAAAIGTAKAVAGIAAAGSGAPGVAAALTGTAAPRSTSSKSSETERNPNTGRQITTGTVSRSSESRGATFGEIAAKAVSNTVGAVMGSKMVVEHSGGFTGNSGYMGVRRPYIIVEIPAIANPRDYSKYNGYPSMITARLGDCTGYTEVQSVQLTGFTATNTELSQIGELLKAGVIL